MPTACASGYAFRSPVGRAFKPSRQGSFQSRGTSGPRLFVPSKPTNDVNPALAGLRSSAGCGALPGGEWVFLVTTCQ